MSPQGVQNNSGESTVRNGAEGPGTLRIVNSEKQLMNNLNGFKNMHSS